jgi:hypothetical protein
MADDLDRPRTDRVEPAQLELDLPAPRTGAPLGTVYLLHAFDPATGETRRYEHAGHYLGWAEDLEQRLAEHMAGRGARLVRVMLDAGLALELVKVWPDVSRAFERQLKRRGGAAQVCPRCRAEHPPRGRPGHDGQAVRAGEPATVPPPAGALGWPTIPALNPARLADRLRQRSAAGPGREAARRGRPESQPGSGRARAELIWRSHEHAGGEPLSAKELASRAQLSLPYARTLLRSLRAATRGGPDLAETRAAARARRRGDRQAELDRLGAEVAGLDERGWLSGAWLEEAACRGSDLETFFPEPGDTAGLAAARHTCAGCGVRAACLRLALTGARSLAEDAGIYAGTTPQERARLRDRRFPAPSVYALDRELASGAHQLAGALGSTRAAARALGVSPQALRAAWARHQLAAPSPAAGPDLPVPPGARRLVLASASQRARPAQAEAFLALNPAFARPPQASAMEQYGRARGREELEVLGARVLAARFDENAQHTQHRWQAVTRRAATARARAREARARRREGARARHTRGRRAEQGEIDRER